MTLQPQLKTIPEKKLIGIHLRMSLIQNKTAELWRTLMPRRQEIQNSVNADLISLQVYDAGYYENFSPVNEFEKWALSEVTSTEIIPAGMEVFTIPAGLYAVFHYKGSSTDPSIFQYIFSTWLPQSGYVLDQRPHFEVLGEKYKNNDPESEEEIWIPVKLQ